LYSDCPVNHNKYRCGEICTPHLQRIEREHPIFASGVGYARATRKNGESVLILQTLCVCKISAWNEDCTIGMLPIEMPRTLIISKFMSSLLPTVPTLKSLETKADESAKARDYQVALNLYEQIIELDPSYIPAYWQLGLMYLLLGQESEAYCTWMFILSDEDSEESKQRQLELSKVLDRAATEQVEAEDLEKAWLIRHYLREVNAADIENTLHLINLSIQIKRFEPTDLDQLSISNLLRTADGFNVELLFDTVKLVFEVAIESSQTLEFFKYCLPHFRQKIDSFLLGILIPIEALFKVRLNHTLALEYLETILPFAPHHPDFLMLLSGLYQDMKQYQKGIEFADRYYQTCKTTLKKLLGNGMRLRSHVITGAHWQTVTDLIQQQTKLLHDWLMEKEDSDELMLAILGAPVFFYPYISDQPQANRSLQNQVAQQLQLAFNMQVKHPLPDYVPYPTATPNHVLTPTEKTTIKKIQALHPSKSRSSVLTQPALNQRQRKLKIGYLSRCFRRHSVGWLCRWLFEHYDRDRFETHLYFNHQVHIDPFAKHWFVEKVTSAATFSGDIAGIAQAIQEDEIDILVDLDSITTEENCGVMALKPAPVQITWLGLDASGIPAVDYFIADPYVLPDNAQAYYSEKIWRLPQTYIAVDGFEVGTPTIRRDDLNLPVDAVLFFSCQSGYKRHPDTIRLQLKVIKEVPNSYLLIKGLGDEKGIQSVFEIMAEAEGISIDRLRFLGRTHNEETHRANLGIADIVLDTFPYNGATTTMETLWMGIPMVTKVGQQFAARNSYGMMMNAGITEGIAWSDEEYIEWGVRLGKDAVLREEIREKLRRSRQTSPLWNAKQFTKEMEKAYEQMWQIYLQS
jgi:predicted O-linked N-acetylglucosamine transferase (SPINDLY family)